MTWFEFRQLILQNFSLSEVRTLCFDLNIDYEVFPDKGKEAVVRELIRLVRRNDRMPELVDVLSKNRPNVPWDAILAQRQPPYFSHGQQALQSVVGAVVLLGVAAVLVFFIVWPADGGEDESPSAMPEATKPLAVVAAVETAVSATPSPSHNPSPTQRVDLPGGYLLFSQYPATRFNQAVICTFDLETKNTLCLDIHGFNPSWAPQRDQIVLAVETGSGKSTLYWMAHDGSSYAEIPGVAALNPRNPVWSADGARVAFVGQNTSTDSNLFILETNGQIRQLTTNPNLDYAVDWSPESVEQPQVVFIARYVADSEIRQGIFTMLVDAPEPENTSRLLYSIPQTAGLLFATIWSPNSRYIAFQYSATDFNICLLDLQENTQNPRCFLVPGGQPAMAWSPDSRFIAYLLYEHAQETTQIRLLDLSSGETSILSSLVGYQLDGLSWK